MTQMLTIEKARTTNSSYKKLVVQWLNEVLCFVPILVKVASFCVLELPGTDEEEDELDLE